MPAANTYETVATTTLTSAQSSITFSNISSSFTDLVLITSTKLVSGITSIKFRANGDTGSNYSYIRMYGNDQNQAVSDRGTGQTGGAIGFTSETNYVPGIYILNNYSSTTANKTMLGRSGVNDYGGYVFAYVSLWRSNSAVTSLTVFTDNGTNWQTGSTFSLYGIKSA